MNKYRKKISTPVMGACTVMFIVFSLVFLNWQSGVLTYSQKVLSSGLTSYQPLLGNLLITAVLMLLAYLLYRFIATNLYFLPAIYFMPSLLILAALTDGRIAPNGGLMEGNALWWMIVLTILMILGSLMLRRIQFISNLNGITDTMKSMIINLSVMMLLCLLTTGLSNTDSDEHTDLRVEQLIKEENYDELLEMLDKTQTADSHTLMGKALAMAKKGQIGENFFEHPQKGSSADLLPSQKNPLLIIDGDPLYREIGGVPGKGMSARECLELLQKRGKLRNNDYLLLADLLDKDLPQFAKNINTIYGDTLPAQMPRYYKEALIVYKHTSTNPTIDFTDEAMEEDYDGFRKGLKGSKVTLRDSYGDTYWYYFFNL